MATFYEKQQDDGNALVNFGFDVTGGSAKSAYYLDSFGSYDIQGTINQVLGNTDTAVQSGRQGLGRQLPLRHPKLPYLFASKISSFTGVGLAGGIAMGRAIAPAVAIPPTDPALAALNAQAITNYLQYGLYEVGVEFTGPRTYPIVSNSVITNQSGSWTRPDGTSQSYSWAPEFLRYTDFDFFPQDNTIQGQQGQMTLYRLGEPVPFTSPPWFWLPDQILKITWYQVPYRFILSPNSYIANSPWRGRVNQNQLWLWPPGSLLYLSYNVKKYAPPTGFTQTLQNSQGLYSYFNFAQLCDIELSFLLTKRATASIGGSTGNANYVTAGHNLLPDLVGNTFWYATRNDKDGNDAFTNPPAWLSAPLECLFSDPDAGGGPDLI